MDCLLCFCPPTRSRYYIMQYIMQLGKKNLFCEFEVWCPSKARATIARVKLIFFLRCTRLFFQWGVKKCIFLLAGRKMDFITPCGQTKSIFWPPGRKKICVLHGKNTYFTRVVFTLTLLGHQTSQSKNKFFSLVAQHTIVFPQGAIKFTLWAAGR